MAVQRQPWMKWYPSDWRAEPRLRMCSRAARSLWLDMLGLMHEADPYGHLIVGGIAPNPRQLAALLGDLEKDVVRWLAELEEASVYSVNEQGVIYSRRMVRDKEREAKDRENGKRGGNPKLVQDGYGEGLPTKPTGGLTGGVKAQKPDTRSQNHNLGDDSPEPRATPPVDPPQPEPPPQPPANGHAQPATDKARVQAATERICTELGVSLTQDTKRLNWPGIVGDMLDSGLDLERHLIPAAQIARSRGKTAIAYVRSVAQARRDREAEGDTRASHAAALGVKPESLPPIPPGLEITPPEQTTFSQWGGRLSAFLANPDNWSPYWGPNPEQEDCKAHPKALEEYRKRKAQIAAYREAEASKGRAVT